MNLVDSCENRLGYACAFGTTVAKLLNILLSSDFTDTFDETIQTLQADPRNPSWTGSKFVYSSKSSDVLLLPFTSNFAVWLFDYIIQIF